ncbi:MAG: VOC family protein [Planctomycetota bacterium]|nr:VOC family protein [Planctomycetota bacterium]MDA1140542.1 VOC family protein [Planctomycetota bacterium]
MKVSQTAPLLFVSDIVESSQFYCNGLGFEMTSKWEPDGQLAWCWLQHGGAALMLQQVCDEDPPAGMRGKGVCFYFICEDTDAVYREITERGIKATEPTTAFYGMKQIFLKDPDGYELCFENPSDAS